MKKVLTLFLITLIISSLFSVPKKPMLELFSSSTCGPCAYANPIVDEVLSNNEGQYSLIKYQMNWPGNGDDYYIEDGGTRRNYYSVTGVPSLFGNGLSMTAQDFDQAALDELLNEETNMDINIDASILNDIIEIDLDLEAFEQYEGGLVLQIGIVEKITTGNVGTNGETEFHNVLMKMLPDAEGTVLEAFTADEVKTFTHTYDMSTTNMEQAQDLSVVAFIQNNENKELIQSQMVDVSSDIETFSVEFNVEDSEGNFVEEALIELEDYGSGNTDSEGNLIFEGVTPGTYSYEIIKAGLLPTSGECEVTAEDISIDVVLEVPNYLFYEDFEADIPEDWTVYDDVANGDYLYTAEGKVILFRQSGTDSPLMLVTPEIDLSNADFLYFDSGEAAIEPVLSIGTVTDPADPETYTEIVQVNPTVAMEEFMVDLSEINDSVSLAWCLMTTNFDYCSLDNIKITAGETNTNENNINISSSLQKIYPNPFSETLRTNLNIQYQISSHGNVEIDIFNLKGQKIKSIKEGFKKKNVNYTVQWNGKTNSNNKAASGVYFIKLKVNDNTNDVKKCILLK